MILEKIKPSFGGKQFFLYFSGGIFFPILPDDIVVLKLFSGQEIGDELYQKIVASSQSFLLKSYALRQLAISPKTEKILRSKLKIKLQQLLQKHRYPSADPSLIDETITYLQERHLINHQQFIDYFLRRHPNKSRRHLQSLLQRQGIKYLAPPQSEVDTIKKILQRKNVTPSLLSQYPARTRLVASLVRKGFSLTDVKNAIDEISTTV